MGNVKVEIDVFRFDPGSGSGPGYRRYTIPYRRGLTVQAALRTVYETLDPTLAFRDYHCGTGICNSCTLRVDGAVVKACHTPLEPGSHVRIEPRNSADVVRDLVSGE